MLEGSIAFTLSGATEFKKMGFGSLTMRNTLSYNLRIGHVLLKASVIVGLLLFLVTSDGLDSYS